MTWTGFQDLQDSDDVRIMTRDGVHAEDSGVPRCRSLQNLVSDSMAIDMGSASTITVRGRGVVVDEPSLVAVDTVTGDVITDRT